MQGAPAPDVAPGLFASGTSRITYSWLEMSPGARVFLRVKSRSTQRSTKEHEEAPRDLRAPSCASVLMLSLVAAQGLCRGIRGGASNSTRDRQQSARLRSSLRRWPSCSPASILASIIRRRSQASALGESHSSESGSLTMGEAGRGQLREAKAHHHVKLACNVMLAPPLQDYIVTP